MRVTHGMLSETTVRNLGKVVERLDRLQDQLTSGHRISKPADDPVGVYSALGFRSDLERLAQHVKNVDSATAWLTATDQTLASVGDALARARELAVQGASGTLSPEDQQTISQEVGYLMEQVLASANATYGDQYLFGGFQTSSAPFTAAGAPPTGVVYNGDSGQILREVGDRVTMAVNIAGGGPFPQVFQALINLRDRLAAGDSAGVSHLLTDLDTAVTGVLAARAQVGAKVNRMETTMNLLEGWRARLEELLSKTQDVDMAEAISNYAVEQNVYQAALRMGARALQPSLLDFLR